MSWDDDLTGAAFHVASSDAPRLRVRAGPGTGKTFSLMRRIARYLEEGVHPKRILVSTFTRIAASDLKSAVAELDAPGALFVQATTIHGLCFGILSRHEVLDITGRVARPLLDFECRFMLEDLKLPEFGDIHRRRKRLKAFEAAWARLQDELPGWPTDPLDRWFQDSLLDWLRFHRAMLIGELVPEALRYLQYNPEAQELNRFAHVIVDEYQDLNVAEQRVVDLLASDATLTVVGDEDQSIYSFKHAYPDGIRDFDERNQETEDALLDSCRRCPKAIVTMANELIKHNATPARRALQPYNSNADGEVRIIQWESIQTEANGIARFISGRLVDGVHPGRVLVLSPSRVIGYAIRDALNAIDVQAHSYFQEQAVEGDPKDLNKSRAQQAVTLLTLAANPSDAVALRCWCGFGSPQLRTGAWDRVCRICKETGRSVVDVLGEISVGKRALPHGTQLRKRLDGLQEQLHALDGLVGRDLIDALFPEGDDDLRALRELTYDIASDADTETVLDAVRTRISQPELPTDVDYVRVMSLHKSKGLTANLVVVTGCIEKLLPRIDRDASEEVQAAALEEQRRLFYVALTRTRDTVILSSVTKFPRREGMRYQMTGAGDKHTVETQTSRFIHELGSTRPLPIRGERLLEE